MKRKTIEKILSVALAVCILLTATPLAGFVGMKLPDFSFSLSASAAEVASGTCGIEGDNLTWTLDDAGLLTVEGTGEMVSWRYSSNVPWNSSRSSIKKVIIGSGVTSIGAYAFYYCRALTAIDLSGCAALRSIGDYAFYDCDAMTAIDLSGCAALSSIGDGAFYSCHTLTEIDLSACTLLSSIGDSAFKNCYYLTAVDLSGCTALSYIGDYAFEDCRTLMEIDLSGCTDLSSIGGWTFQYCYDLTAIRIANDNQYYTSQNGVLFNKAMTELICYPAGKTDTSYTVPTTVAVICDRAFQYCIVLTKIDLSNCTALSSIGDSAFSSCDALTEIDLSGCTALRSIGSSAFWGCSALMEMDLSGCTALRSIGSSAFSNCTALTDISIANDNQYYTSQNGVLFNKAMTELICYPAGKTDTSYTVSATVTVICEYAFQYCYALTAIKIGNDACEIYGSSATIPDNTVISCNAGSLPQAYARKCGRTYKALDGHAHELTKTVIAPSCTAAGHAAHICSVCGETVYIDNITSANGHTDSDSDGVCDICGGAYATITAAGTIGEGLLWSLDSNGLLSIEGTGAMISWTSFIFVPWYSSRSSIKKVIIGSGVTSIGVYAFQDCSTLTEVDLSGCTALSSIGDYAFSSCDALTEMDLSACTALRFIGNLAFYDCDAITDIRIANDNQYYTSQNGVLFNKAMTELICYPAGKTETSYTVPSTVTVICEYAFSSCTTMTAIDLSACTALSSIGSFAFRDCSALTEIDLSGCTELRSIRDAAFYYCTALTEIDLSACTALSSIGDRALQYCGTLKAIDLSACTALRSIEYSAFSNCGALTAIDLSGCTALRSIGDAAFQACDALTAIDLSACTALRSIGDYAFRGCFALKSISIANDNQYYTSPGGVLYNKAMTELICYPAGITDTSYTVPSTVTVMCKDALFYCSALTEIDLSGCIALSSIGDETFQYCCALTEIDLSACTSLRSIGDRAFSYCDALTEIDFSGCTALRSIGGSAFRDCDALMEIDLSACTALRSIGSSAFSNCTALTAIKICNPDCEIYDSTFTIDFGATIYGYIGSTAEAYATKYARAFVALIPHTHIPGDWVVKQVATCTIAGRHYKECIVCHTVLETEAIAATGHTVVDDDAVEPTCTLDGLTAGTHCTVCIKVLTAQSVIDAIGHIDSNEDDVCDRCGAELKEVDPSETCSCSCHKSGISGFIWKLKCLLNKLFRVESKRYCECGKAHW